MSLLTEDYAVVGFLPGLNPARSVLILAGTTTFGTQAAVEYVCRNSRFVNCCPDWSVPAMVAK